MLERAASSLPARSARAIAKIAAIALLGLVVALVPGASACRALDPSNKPVDACVKMCNARASRQCSEAECARGCEFILDRILERESQAVIGCVAGAARRCADVVWAECAAQVGIHADGGPPQPPPPPEEE